MAERFDLKLIEEPVAFVKRTQDANDGFTRVVVFSEKKSGHFKSKAQFHAFQVRLLLFTFMAAVASIIHAQLIFSVAIAIRSSSLK